MAATTPTIGSGFWTTSSSATIVTPASPTSAISGLSTAGTYTFIWTVTNGPCVARDTVVITVTAVVTANAGPDQSLCAATTATTATLAGNSPAPGSGTWTSLGSATVTTPSSATSGVTGLITGNNLFVWTITNGSCSTTDTVNIEVSDLLVADAGTDQQLCALPGTATLAANNAAPGTGQWSTSSLALISDPSDPATGVSALTTAGSYAFVWTITNGACISNDTMEIVVDEAIVPDAGTDMADCENNTALLTANAASPGTGLWGSTGPAVFADPNSENTLVSDLAYGPNILVWTITNGTCVLSDTLIVINDSLELADAGADQVACQGSSIALSANAPVNGSGLWTSASGSFSDPADPAATLSGMNVAGQFDIIWTITNGTCSSSDTMIVSIDSLELAVAGPDQDFCETQSSTVLSANTPTSGSGLWSTTSSAVIADPADPNSSVGGLTPGTYELVWTITNGTCTSSDTISITVSAIPTIADAGADQSGCADAGFVLSGNVPATGTGTWSTPATAVIDDPLNPASTVSNLPAGSTTFIWTITNGTCSSSDTTEILVFPLPIADAGADQNVTSGTSVTIGGSPAASGGSGNYSYVWQPGNGLNDSTIANPQVVVTVTSTFVLTVSDSAGCSSSDTITIWINNPPDAVNDSLITDEDNALPVSLLLNDTDPENNLDTSSVVILSGPFNGTWIAGTGGNGTYVPNPDFYGVDSVYYTVCDSGMPVFCDSAWVFITINPINDTPVVQDDFGVTVEDSCISINIYTNDSDIEGMLDLSTLTVVSSFSNGSFTLDTLSGLLTYCPDSNFTGTDTLVYALCDSGFPLPALCDTAFVVISVGASNDPPVVVNDTISACAGTLSAAILIANDFDPEGDSLSVNLVTGPLNGTAILNSSWDLLYTSDPAYSGWDSLQYEACDQSGLCSQAWLYIYVHPLPQASVVITPVACAGDSSGAIDVTMQLAGNYLFSWSHGPVTEDVSALPAGVYTVQISDSNGCVLTITDSVPGPAVPLVVNATVQVIACFGDSTGAIDLLVSGGTAPYTFAWSNGGTSEDIDSLTTGVYSVLVTDSAGCTATLTDSVVTPSSALSVSLVPQHIICFGDSSGSFAVNVNGGTAPYSYLWSNGDTVASPTGLIAGIYALTVTDSLGCTFSVNDSLLHLFTPLQVQSMIVSPSCLNASYGSIDLQVSGGAYPYQYVWTNGDTTNVLDSLTAGLYEVVITDSAGCTFIDNWQLNDSSQVFISLSGDSVLCQGEQLVLTATSVAQAAFAWYFNGSALPDTTGQITITDAGSYTVEVNTGCGLLTAGPVNVLVNPLPVIDAGQDMTVSCDSAVTLTVQGALSYSWMPASLFSDPGNANPQVLTNSSTIISVTGIDANGCSSTDSLVLTVQCDSLVIPNGFSPNGDGFNDFFVISNLGRYPNAILRIYNRWGNLVYEKERYDNTWNGFSNVDMISLGEVLPDGTYFYVLDPNNGENGFTGFVVLRR
jgi:gliding motility-associated-like protein